MFKLNRWVSLVCGAGMVMSVAQAANAAQAGLWTDAQPAAGIMASRDSAPRAARMVNMDLAGLRQWAQALPDEHAALSDQPLLSVPLPDGGSLTFRLHATQVMAPQLAARYPQIRTFAGTATDGSGVQGRFDIGPRGFHAQIFLAAGTAYIDPVSRRGGALHQVYFDRDLSRQRPETDELIEKISSITRPADVAPNVAAATAGVSISNELRTYRLALATTGEYAEYQDPNASTPDKAVVLAELVNVTNRVTGIYEREVGVRLELIAQEDDIIYTDPDTDPYINYSGSIMVNTNTRTLNNVIGASAYDIGHVVSTGGGGIAGLGVVCGSSKGAGVTGLSNPVGDGFYVDYVAHEMGHQFGANHTFNSQSGSCGGGNRNGSTAYEPGSGSTIMAYAGICGDDDLQPHSDDYFHAVSFDEIVDYTRNDTGNSCPVVTSVANKTTKSNAGEGGFTIPMQTPFELTGKGSDKDGGAVTYQWEEWDLGAAGSPDSPDATAPLFRSFQPSTSPTRVFPQASDLADNTHTIGEILPAVARDLTFRLTVRDNEVAPSSGGVSSSELSFHVTDAAGPFKVTQPNSGGGYTAGAKLKVKWDVAGTDLAPVSCAAVDIWLSTDGGYTWDTRLVKNKVNDGVQKVTLPVITTDTARIKVKCHDNVFFDISDVDFSIIQP